MLFDQFFTKNVNFWPILVHPGQFGLPVDYVALNQVFRVVTQKNCNNLCHWKPFHFDVVISS